MTICIAAISKDVNDDELIVFATDNMISIQQIGQFEMDIDKYKRITEETVAMLSGDPLIFNDILIDCKECNNFDGMKKKIQENMANIKNERVQKQLLDTYKIDYEYLKEALKQPIQNAYLSQLFENVTKFTLNTGILLIGFKENDAQITEITETHTNELTDINFHAIGSGAVQALNTLLFQKHSKNVPLSTTIYNVYKAKRNAEVSIGVGTQTDMMILSKSGVTEIEKDKMEVLSKIYEEELNYGKNHDDVQKMIKPL